MLARQVSCSGICDLALALVTAYAATIAFFPALGATKAKRTFMLIVLGSIILMSPLFVPSSQPLLRLIASLNTTALVIKLYDLHVDPGRAGRMRFAAFLIYLPNYFNLVPRKNRTCYQGLQWQEFRRIAMGLPLLGVGVVLTTIVFKVNWEPYAFLVEHSVKVVVMYFVVASASVVGAATWRLIGSTARDIMAHPEVAPTPAEFWKRWNQPAQQFLYEDVFKRIGGFRSPACATLFTFSVSAAIHEYVFGIATGHVQGYQTAFFLLHGCVAAATSHVRPTGGWRIVGTVLTLVFVLLSSVLFFRSVNAIVPFYDNDPASLWSLAWSHRRC